MLGTIGICSSRTNPNEWDSKSGRLNILMDDNRAAGAGQDLKFHNRKFDKKQLPETFRFAGESKCLG